MILYAMCRVFYENLKKKFKSSKNGHPSIKKKGGLSIIFAAFQGYFLNKNERLKDFYNEYYITKYYSTPIKYT